jgi:hypothetical protein
LAGIFDDDRIPGEWCQASAISFFDGWIYVASDSEVPGGSSVFRYRKNELEKKAAPQWVRNPLLDNLKKIEDSTVTPDGKYIFFVTAFDRFKPADAEYDWYNALVCMDRDGRTLLAMPSENPQRHGSLALRNSIGRRWPKPVTAVRPATSRLRVLLRCPAADCFSVFARSVTAGRISAIVP